MKFIIFLLSLFTVTSCDYFLEREIQQDEQNSYISPYKGIWIGKYAGDEIGDLKIEVAKNGVTSITRITQYTTESTFFSGMVRDDGALQQVVLDSGFTLYGNMELKGGTWKMSDWKGTWSIVKQ